MTLDEMIGILFPAGGGIQPTEEQLAVLHHEAGPGWVLAGPGSGKTEVLTLLVLRLLFCENDPVQAQRVPPAAIVVTTFTEKAARNLEDRISSYRSRLVAQRPDLAHIDISKLRLGTLHGLCNDILQEYRAPNYQNVRLMDQLETAMFVHEHLSIAKATPDEAVDRPFWTEFADVFSQREWKPDRDYMPSKWPRANAMVQLLDKVVEGRASVAAMRDEGGPWERLADLYDEYRAELDHEHRCDFAHLQAKFLEFLASPLGETFKEGSEESGMPGIEWVLVDEYQDTNLIQEEIYMTLAQGAGRNLVVVGDDDQALYRFRGGSVECMVTFDAACETFLGIQRADVQSYPLVANFRSHPQIVDFCNDYITSFPAMSLPGARVPGKPLLSKASPITGSYTAVGQLRAGKMEQLADKFAETVEGLLKNQIVSDYNQCCLLLKSTKESPRNALPYVEALAGRGIPVYNPRNKAFLEQEEVQGLLGALLAILDPTGRHVPERPTDLADMIGNCSQRYDDLAAQHADLAGYVADVRANLTAHTGRRLSSTLQELVYHLLALEPFSSWAGSANRRARLARVTALIESYASMPVQGHPNVSRGSLKASETYPGEISSAWMPGFYYLFFGYLCRTGLDEEESEDAIAPPGMVSVMTMHQAKGLQFPFVFVGHMGETPSASTAHRLETEFAAFPTRPERSFTLLPEDTRAELDMIRQYYVAYSRAQWALLLMGTEAQFKKGATPCGPTRQWLPNHVLPL